MTDSKPLQQLLDTLPQVGRVEWIGVRPARGQPMVSLEAVEAKPGKGLIGDRYSGRPGSARQVTLIQQEHLAVIAACLHSEPIRPSLLRRNIVVSGINLLALKGRHFQIGEAILAFSGLCQPCSKMEQQLGTGGYNAMRGHGGITARVVQPGRICLDDPVSSHGTK